MEKWNIAAEAEKASGGLTLMPFGNSNWPESDGKMQPRWGRSLLGRLPRVAPPSRPWAERWNPFGIQARNFRKALGLTRIFHSHFGKSREKPYENRGANTCEGVVEKTRHAGLETCEPKLGLPAAGWEACATTLECRCVSRRMVARLQRLMAIMASKPRALPWAVLWRPFRPCIRTAMLEEESHGFSIAGTAQGLRYGRLGSLRYLGWKGHGWFYYEISGLTTKLWTPAMRDPRAEARVGACAPRDQSRQRIAGCHWKEGRTVGPVIIAMRLKT